MKQKLLSVVEWSKRNGLTQRTVRRMIKDGRIKTKPLALFILGIPENFKVKK